MPSDYIFLMINSSLGNWEPPSFLKHTPKIIIRDTSHYPPTCHFTIRDFGSLTFFLYFQVQKQKLPWTFSAIGKVPIRKTVQGWFCSLSNLLLPQVCRQSCCHYCGLSDILWSHLWHRLPFSKGPQLSSTTSHFTTHLNQVEQDSQTEIWNGFPATQTRCHQSTSQVCTFSLSPESNWVLSFFSHQLLL